MCLPDINKQGYPFIGIAFLLSCAGFAFSSSVGIFCAVITMMFVFFFRDPARVVPTDDALIVSPADGKVTSVEEVDSPLNDGKKVTRVSIFLSVFDVHVNRVPVSGMVKLIDHRPGKLSPAFGDGSVADNERVRSVIESVVGSFKIVVEQIAGICARRISCDLEVGSNVALGDRMGIIRFGSRMNVYIPAGVPIQVSVGRTVVAGETVLADLGRENSDNSPPQRLE